MTDIFELISLLEECPECHHDWHRGYDCKHSEWDNGDRWHCPCRGPVKP